MLKILLYQPLIPYNTGNIIRLCSNVGATLHLIHPLGFSLEDKLLKRAGLDYFDLSIIREYSSIEEYLSENDINRIFATTSKAKKIYSDITYKIGDTLLFGPEDLGLPQNIYKKVNPNSEKQVHGDIFSMPFAFSLLVTLLYVIF